MYNELEIRNYDSKEDLTRQAQSNFLIYGNLDSADRFVVIKFSGNLMP